MRRLLFLVITLFVLNSNVYSQSYNLIINLSNGETVTIPIDDIQRIVFGDDATGVEDPELPSAVKLMQNYPNPFNPSTTITYQIPKEANVKISIFDTSGRLVKEILNETQTEGLHQVTWDGTNKNNAHVASGIYFYTANIDNVTLSRKMVLLK
jgi:hypothetical protein